MTDDVDDGWAASAAAWIIEQGEDGDYGRRFVLDAPMRARIEGRGFRNALDVGCGEGRFCRIMQRAGIRTTGIDPTEALLARAMGARPPRGLSARSCRDDGYRCLFRSGGQLSQPD
ncbi:SAM-dependent methyltransferase [Bradyrhizobium diazoefficiens]